MNKLINWTYSNFTNFYSKGNAKRKDKPQTERNVCRAYNKGFV